MAKAGKTLNLSALDMSIDDIEELPGFECPLPGYYSLKFKTSVKEVNDKQCIECAFEVVELIEAEDPDSEEQTKPGTKFSTLHMLDNEFGMASFKEIITPVAKHFNETNVLKLVTETCKDEIAIAAMIKRRKAKKKDDDDEDAEVKYYPVISRISVV